MGHRHEELNVVDSSAWLEYMDDGPNADVFESSILQTDRLLVPVICLLEVFKKVLRERGEDAALHAVASMQLGTVVELDSTIALEAARLGAQHKLPLADSVIYATARMRGAVVWTQDEHFQGLPGVQYVRKAKAL